MLVKDNVLDLDGGRVEKIRVSQKLFQEKKYFRRKAGRWDVHLILKWMMDDKMETWCSLLGLVTSRCL